MFLTTNSFSVVMGDDERSLLLVWLEERGKGK
jgi:hypothetical protein